VPLIFTAYAADLAHRLAPRAPARVLEVAAGTGAVTRTLADTLGDRASLVATDLNQAMLDRAAAVGTSRPVEFRQADAQALPFPDASFDAVVCQFGAMFFPEKTKAYAEARRVLRPGGVFLFNVWDRLTENEFAHAVSSALEGVFPSDPPRFLSRVPYGYCDGAVIHRELTAAGFSKPAHVETVTHRCRADSPRIPSVGFCLGSPLRGEIEARSGATLDEAVDAATREVARRFGTGAVDSKMQALVITAEV
jgi:SAM-dependent methyltransferase